MKFKKEQKIAMLEEKMVMVVMGAARWGVRVVLRRSGNCRHLQGSHKKIFSERSSVRSM
jgi:hypothetical protein